jgi:DNA-binding NtrC family response regulator
LRQRPEDIPLLAEYFLQAITRKNGMARIRLSAEAVDALQQHHWPGNVRELENTIARACGLAGSPILLPADIPLASAPGSPPELLREALDRLINSAPAGIPLIDWAGRELAARVLDRSSGDLKEAAILLKLPPAGLKKLLSAGVSPTES